MSNWQTNHHWVALRALYRSAESECLPPLLQAATMEPEAAAWVHQLALRLATRTRELTREQSGVEALLQEYDLSSEEGVLLMCLAEALLRIPDSSTAESLIRDKLAHGRWDLHLGRSESLLVNASTWGLLLTGRIVSLGVSGERGVDDLLAALSGRLGSATARLALNGAMEVLAGQFVMGGTMASALKRARRHPELRYSYDCLGEAARTAEDADAYFQAYRDAVAALAKDVHGTELISAPSISVKLSALDPRYEFAQAERVLPQVVERLGVLVEDARAAGVGVTVDAEEADRLELSLQVFARVGGAPFARGWDGFGIAVQAYQKRAPALLGWLQELSMAQARRIPVRLVKGAYWDTEIKRAQERGLDGYPVYTRKAATDVAYLACARRVLAAGDCLYGQFATHNAYTLAYLVEIAGQRRDFEFQRLHGMGEPLFRALAEAGFEETPCRVYAPVGSYENLLPYLVRRLLENGANTSFINQLADADISVEALVENPVDRLRESGPVPHHSIPLPEELYGADRRNSAGLDFSDPVQWGELERALRQMEGRAWRATPIVDGHCVEGEEQAAAGPACRTLVVGTRVEAQEDDVEQALTAAASACRDWDATGGESRAKLLEHASDLFQEHAAELVYLCVHEAGRCPVDAWNELREAIDFLRYYALQARTHFAAPVLLPGPTGERNEMSLHGRGVFACISPWNFPLSIFTGQIAAALAAGNAVVAKPARQTPLVACHAVQLLQRAGVPGAVLHCLPGGGAQIGERLIPDHRINGVAFTGSTATASRLQEMLTRRGGAIVPLIAETGGQNVMIADSSALIEQLVADVIASAFNSAGQRCSALRVLYVQEDIAERVLAMLAGAMQTLCIGDPARLDTDVGPVIDETARDKLEQHRARMRREARVVCELTLPDACANGVYVAPSVYEISSLQQLTGEVFGPILHVLRFKAGELDRVVDQVNTLGFGLTLGVHTRIEDHWQRICARARVGNQYVNRNMIGAVVGVQPFGGEGLSGTGPKAGGPHYLFRFASERTLSVNTAAMGGNASLLALGGD